MVTVEEIEAGAREYSTRIIEKFNQPPDSPRRDLLSAAYVAGANRVIKSFLNQSSEEVVTNAN